MNKTALNCGKNKGLNALYLLRRCSYTTNTAKQLQNEFTAIGKGE